MRMAILLLSSVSLLTACNEAEAPTVEQPSLSEYKAAGTEPFWNVDFTGEEISYSEPAEDNNFAVPLNKVTKTQTGWIVNGYDSSNNIRLEITTGKTCSDGMSERKYADTVLAAVSNVGNLNGCGGEIISGGDTAP